MIGIRKKKSSKKRGRKATSEEEKTTFKKLLKTSRVELGLTQVEMSEQLGVQPRTVRQWEQDGRSAMVLAKVIDKIEQMLEEGGKDKDKFMIDIRGYVLRKEFLPRNPKGKNNAVPKVLP